MSGAATDVTLADLTFRDGSVGGVFADESGGAILTEDARLRISDGTFVDNSAYEFREGAQGGAIATQGGSLLVEDSSFTSNRHANFGGAISAD